MHRLLCHLGWHHWYYVPEVLAIRERICLQCEKLQSQCHGHWITLDTEVMPGYPGRSRHQEVAQHVKARVSQRISGQDVGAGD